MIEDDVVRRILQLGYFRDEQRWRVSEKTTLLGNRLNKARSFKTAAIGNECVLRERARANDGGDLYRWLAQTILTK